MNSKNPLVSVVINCYNGEKFLKEAIDSVYSQSYNDWEIILWDNSSTDNSAKIAKSYGLKLRYYYSDKNLPLGKARNKALSVCNGELICFLDTDDLMCPDKLKHQVPLFKNLKVGIVSSQTIFFKNNKILGYGPNKNKIPIGNIFSKIIENYFLSIESVIFRKKSLDNILGGYSFNDNFSVCEEADLFIRILFKWDFDFYPVPLSKRRIHDNNISKNNRMEILNENILIINNLIKLIPNFKIKYKKSFETNILWNINNKAVYFIQQKQNNKTRNILKTKFLTNKKSFFLFFLAFFPNFISSFTLRLLKKTEY